MNLFGIKITVSPKTSPHNTRWKIILFSPNNSEMMISNFSSGFQSLISVWITVTCPPHSSSFRICKIFTAEGFFSIANIFTLKKSFEDFSFKNVSSKLPFYQPVSQLPVLLWRLVRVLHRPQPLLLLVYSSRQVHWIPRFDNIRILLDPITNSRISIHQFLTFSNFYPRKKNQNGMKRNSSLFEYFISTALQMVHKWLKGHLESIFETSCHLSNGINILSLCPKSFCNISSIKMKFFVVMIFFFDLKRW